MTHPNPPTPAAEMIELASLVEALSGPDRELDAAIAAVLCAGTTDVDGRYWRPGVRGFSIAPRYTASLDAAMTLVPDDFTGLIPVRGGRLEEAWLWRKDGTMGKGFRITAATPALALTAASLRARAQAAGGGV